MPQLPLTNHRHRPSNHDWPRWGNDPHNPWSGKDRPAFNWAVYRRYALGHVDANGNPVDGVTTEFAGLATPGLTHAP